MYQSEVVPGSWLSVKWLCQELLPKVLDVLPVLVVAILLREAVRRRRGQIPSPEL